MGGGGAHRFLVEKPEGKKPLVRPIRRRYHSTNLYLIIYLTMAIQDLNTLDY